MSIYQAIETLNDSVPMSLSDAEKFLSSLSEKEQEQIIAAIYIGRDHIHDDSLRSSDEISRRATDHIPKDDYARIIYEKNSNVAIYLKKLLSCAEKSGFDLNNL